MTNKNGSRGNKIKAYFIEHPQKREVLLYIIFTFIAFVCDLFTRFIFDILLKGYDQVVKIWIFPPQAVGTLIAFLIANIVAKVVSFIFNRKTTFNANNSRLFSVISYTIMCVAFIIIETIIGAPIQNRLYLAFGGAYNGAALTTMSAVNEGLYQFCGSLSQMIYGICDFVAAFFLDKYIIMKHR
ncbi:MAG: hypothetical protein ACOYBH_09560 [Candidatus Alectryocaccobium sp.]|jgi:drug/metabolite transporter superfamily protein YnfA